MARQKVLVPYNFRANDENALEFVVQRFSKDKEVEVTLLNIYAAVPEIDVRGNPIMQKMAANLNYLRQKIMEQEEEMKKARDRLVENGFSKEQVNYVQMPMKKGVAQDIADYAAKEGFSTVVVNRSPERITRFFTSSVSDKVTRRLPDKTVLMVN